METFLTRAITIVALTCVLVAAAAATSILGRDSVPPCPPQYAATTVAKSPDSNRQAKSDKLAVATFALAAFEPQKAPPLTEPLRQAYAAAGPADLVPSVSAPRRCCAGRAAEAEGRRQAGRSRRTMRCSATCRSPGIKERLKLSPDQESYWPGVEKALRAIARKLHSTKQADPAAGMPPLDPDSDEVQQLKSAAMPLLFQLREDQKNEVRTLARIIGLERVASMI